MKKPLGLKLDVGLIARIDAVRGGVARTAWIEGAIEARLRGGGVGTDRSPVRDLRDALERPGAPGPAVRSVHPRVVSSAGAKAGVVPVWRGTGTD